jgi:hypothetical protein
MRRLVPVLALAWFAAVAAAERAEPRDGSWIHQVERERDRGAGRIVDQPTYDLERVRERADVVAGRVPGRREFERLDEERDRQLRIEQKAREGRPPRLGEAARPPRDGSVVLREQPTRSGPIGPSPLAAVVAREQRELAEARQTLERSTRAADAAESRDLRALRRRLNLEGRPEAYDAERRPIEQHYDELRAGYQRAYDQVRSRIVGRSRAGQNP